MSKIVAKNKRLKIGLALGSGGVRGLAHIGVIKALEANNMPIDFIAGSSIGAVIGGLYAATKNINKIEQAILSNGKKQQLLGMILDPTLEAGFISGDKFKNFLSGLIDDMKFKNLKIPFTAVATDLKTGKPVLINKGDVSAAIRSSMSLPLVFKPIKNGKHILIDGGLSRAVPAEIVRNMGADFVIAVNSDAHCYYHSDGDNLNMIDVINYTMSMLRAHLAEFSAESADVIIKPDVHNSDLIGWSEFSDGEKIVKKGERAMKALIPQIKKKLNEKA